MRNSPFTGIGRLRLLLVVMIGLTVLICSGAPAWADVEDVLLEKGMITKEDWVKIKADKEKIQQSTKGGIEYRVSELSRSESIAALKGVEIGVVMYLNATSASGTSFGANANTGVSTATANNNKGLADGFHFSRTYLNVRKYFENGDHIRMTLDQMVNDVGGNSCVTTGPGGGAGGAANNTTTGGKCTEAAPFGLSGFGGTGRNNTFIKYAYYEHVFLPSVQLRVGMHQTPWIEYEESRWTYRYLFPTMVDQQNAQTSSDLGVSVMGKIKELNDMVDYHISFQEGEGYQNTPDGRGFAVLGRISVEPIKGIIISGFGHDERLRNGITGFNPQRALGNVEVYDPDKDRFKVNGQFVWADDGSNVGQAGTANPALNIPGTYNGGAGNAVITGAAAALGNQAGPTTNIPRFHNARGYEAWAWYRIPGWEKIRLHGRYYFMKPDSHTPAGDIQSYYFGISYDYSKFLAFSIDYTVLQETVLGNQLVLPQGITAISTSAACGSCGQFVNYNNQILGLRALVTF